MLPSTRADCLFCWACGFCVSTWLVSDGAPYYACVDESARSCSPYRISYAMSDVSPTRKELDCIICDFNAKTHSGLMWHYDSVHPREHRRRGTQESNASGVERRRRKLLARRLARTALEQRAAASVPAPPPVPAQSTAPPNPIPPGSAGHPRPRPAANRNNAPRSSPAAGPTAAPASALPGGAHPADLERAVQAEIDGLLTLARVRGDSPPVQPAPRERMRKRHREERSSGARQAPAFEYATLQTKVRAIFEDLNDWQASTPLAVKRRRAKVGKFNNARLRALQRFMLSVGRGGLSLKEQKKLYDFLVLWDSNRPSDDGKLQHAFPTFGSFKTSLKDDVDAGVCAKGWRKVKLVEGGQSYEAFFTPALRAILELVREDKKIHLWSGESAPSPPTSRRESSLDGDAFRAVEKAVIEEHGPNSCVLGIHMFSDAFQVSWSGGTSTCRLF